jgi:hypothetical protein
VTVSELAAAVVLITSALTGIAAVFRIAAGWMVKQLDRRDIEQEARIEAKLDEKIGTVTRELRPNGGSSLWDKVDQLRGDLADLARTKRVEHAEMDRRHLENAERLTHLEDQQKVMRRAMRATLLTVRATVRRPIAGRDLELADQVIVELDEIDGG